MTGHDRPEYPLYKEFVSFAVKDTRMAATLKALNPPGFDPGLPENINFTFDNWISDKMLVGEKFPTVVDGELRENVGQYVWQLQKTYGTRTDGNYGMTDSKWILRNTDDVVKPATGNALNILNPLIQDVKNNTFHPQEVATEGLGSNSILLTQSAIAAILPAARQYWLSQGALASALNSAIISIGQLPTSIAGQTQGSSITLSADGAGWGWFVDTTPTTDEEFTPDVAAQNLRAAAGTAATGKLDLLTVLIHELGHVLGAQDLQRAEDVMSGHLEAGVRRLPTAQDTALWLAAQSQRASAANGANSSTEPAGFGVRVASPATAANPALLGAVAIPAHATLLNGDFAQSSAQWETTGKVDASPSTITLGESTTAQAHLAQSFIITPQDRFLTFTVSGLALQTNSTQQNGILTAAPQDAFEVALTNANTGSKLLAGLATDHSDALLNIQLALPSTPK